MIRSVQPDGTIVLSGDRCAAHIKRLAPGVMYMVYVGSGSAAVDSAAMSEYGKEVEAHGSLQLFCDLRGLTRIASETRENSKSWLKYKGRLHSHLLIKSKLVEMALSVMAMILGTTFKAMTDEARFKAELAQHVPGLQKLPPAPVLGAERAERA